MSEDCANGAVRIVYNRNHSKLWFSILIASRAVAVMLVVLSIAYPEWKYLPRKYPWLLLDMRLRGRQLICILDLTAAYGLTTHEIDVIRGEQEETDGESKFGQFLTDSASAFSREHTQWLALIEFS